MIKGKDIKNAIEILKAVALQGIYIKRYFTVDGQQPKVKIYLKKSDFEIFLN